MTVRKLMQITPGLIASVLLFWIPPVFSQEEEPSVGNLFIQAYDEQDETAMRSLIKNKAAEVPEEVKAMVEYSLSPDAGPQEQDFLFNIAGTMAQMYAEETGDNRLLAAVKSNYKSLLKKRQTATLPPDAVEKVKKELLELGKGDWRIRLFKMNPEKGLVIEINIKESAGGEGVTPTIDFRTSNKAKEIVKSGLPNIKSGKIVWSSIGIGLKTVFLN